jgi:hypothetical protein
LDDLFPAEPLIDEQARKLVQFYRLGLDGLRVCRRGQLMGPKGVGKSPEGARWSLAEHSGPVVFDGWDADGEPVGRPWDKPVVQIAAVSEEQADNTYGALLELLTSDDGRAGDMLGLDVGVTRILRRGQPAARIDAVTASAGTREGQRVTFGLLDETHLWTRTNGGHRLAGTIRRNAAKMGGTTVETTNAYDPSTESVAQATDEAAEKAARGVWQWRPKGPAVGSLANRRDVKRALRVVYEGAHWIDLDRLIDEMHDPDTTEADARRFYLNETVRSHDAAFDPDSWAGCATPGEVVADREPVALGFDGARFHDATALVACRISDGHMWLVECWERPTIEDDEVWSVPTHEVSAAVAAAFDRWKVVRMYADPPYWQDELDSWAGEHGEMVKEWWTTRTKAMCWAVRRFHQAVEAGDLTHDGGDTLARHVTAAQRRSTNVRDDDGRFMWTVEKESPKSPRKIDACVAAVLAYEARGDAVAAGEGKRRKAGAWAF